MASGLTIRKELVVNGLISDITIDWFASQLCILPSGQDELRIVQKNNGPLSCIQAFLRGGERPGAAYSRWKEAISEYRVQHEPNHAGSVPSRETFELHNH